MKTWWQSRSIWAQIVALIATLGTVFGVDLQMDAESQAAIVGGVQAIVAIIMRLITKTPIA